MIQGSDPLRVDRPIARVLRGGQLLRKEKMSTKTASNQVVAMIAHERNV